MYLKAKQRTVAIVAGEASGDMHGASLVLALKKLDPTLRFYGVGGEKMRSAGVELLADSAEMAVVGLTEVFFKLPFILKVLRRLQDSFRRRRPEVVILVDYPDFNLRLAKAAHAQGLKVFYYISPQVWAWRKGRIDKIRAFVDKIAVILPFEVPLYREAGVEAVFVGHPLLDTIPARPAADAARRKIGLQEGTPIVALLPGSRRSEVAKLLPVCLEAAARMQAQMGHQGAIQFVLPLASTLSRDFITATLGSSRQEIKVVADSLYECLAAADLAIVASGTATLETALMGTPMIIIYKVSRLSYLIGRACIRVKNIGLANIIAGQTVAPELIQDEANPHRLAELAGELLSNPARRAAMTAEFAQIREKLGQAGAAARTARLVYDMLGHAGAC